MRRKTDVKPEMAILKVLAEHEEFPQYRLPEQTGLSYRTILRTLRLLEKQGLIRLTKTLPSEKGGKEKNIYAATFKGIVHALINVDTLKDVEKIVRSHPEKLLAFSKLPLFERAGLKVALLENIAEAAQSEIREMEVFKALGRKHTYSSEKEWRDHLDSKVLVIPIINRKVSGKTGEAYKRVCRQDKELRDFIEQELLDLEKKLKTDLEEIRKWNASMLAEEGNL